jgi:hypothetical protein
MFKKRMFFAMLAGAAFPVSAGEYSILPVIGSEVISSDGGALIVDVIDTEYQRGTLMLDLNDGSYESVIGNRADAGSVGGDLSTTEISAVESEAQVVDWNQQVAAGQTPSTGLWVKKVVKYCQWANRQALLAILAAQATCQNAGGTHSGGVVGFCGIGSDTGRCSRQFHEIEP